MFNQLGPRSEFAREQELTELSSGERLHYFETDGWPVRSGKRPGHIMIGGICRQGEPEMLHMATTLRDRRKVVRLASVFEDAWICWYWLPVLEKAQSPETSQPA